MPDVFLQNQSPQGTCARRKLQGSARQGSVSVLHPFLYIFSGFQNVVSGILYTVYLYACIPPLLLRIKSVKKSRLHFCFLLITSCFFFYILLQLQFVILP